MNKTSMIAGLMDRGFSRQQATDAVEYMLEEMRRALLSEEDVVLMNVGTLKSKKRVNKSRMSFGKEIEIKQDLKVSFRPSAGLEKSSVWDKLKEL